MPKKKDKDLITIPAALRAALVAMRGDDFASLPIDTSTCCPISQEIKNGAKKAFQTMKPGDNIKGQGIYIGKYTPHDRGGKSLRRIFHVFAAPQDLSTADGSTYVFTYTQTVLRMGQLKNWHGYNGAAYQNDSEFYQALKDHSYKGEWVIPPLNVLNGYNHKRNKVRTPNIFEIYSAGYFITTPKNQAFDFDSDSTYWSCTEHHMNPTLVLAVDFQSRVDYSNMKNNLSHRCRPVRFVEANARAGAAP